MSLPYLAKKLAKSLSQPSFSRACATTPPVILSGKDAEAIKTLLDIGLADSDAHAVEILKQMVEDKVLVLKPDDQTYTWGTIPEQAEEDSDPLPARARKVVESSSTDEESSTSEAEAKPAPVTKPPTSESKSEASSDTADAETKSEKASEPASGPASAKPSSEADKKKPKAKKRAKSDDDVEAMTVAAIDEEIQGLIATLADLAPEVRHKLNTSAFSDLISSLLEEAKAVSSDKQAPEPEIRKSAIPKSLNRINREVDSNMASFSTQLVRLKTQSDTGKKRKVLNALREMKKGLNSALNSDKDQKQVAFLDGEESIWKVEEVSATGHQGTFVGKIIFTNYRLFHLSDTGAPLLAVPLALIWSASKIDKKKKNRNSSGKKPKVDKQKDSTRSYKKLELILKDQRVVYLYFKRDAIDELLERLKSLVATMPTSLFCWKYTAKFAFNGWAIYDPVKEFQRMGVPNGQWRLTDVNKNWALSDTYPQTLAVPTSVDDDLVQTASNFRSRNRFPALAFRHYNGATITRCSQPAVGVSRKRSKEDEKLLFEISQTNPAKDQLPILDARPKANAVANFAMGFGFEVISHYPNCTITFCDIENIHVMRNSLFKLRDTLYTPDDGKWCFHLDATGWLYHQYMILQAATKTVDLIHSQATSVLVHCTDGWDRTSQMISLAAMLLDPYYRTLTGFIVMIEKDWLSFGHRFGMRHAIDGKDSSDRAPIFHQFVEVVWQLTQQFPLHFEFNEKFLIVLLDELYHCRFGTFLYDCEKERVEAETHLKTPSLWSYVMDHKADFVNPLFQAAKGVLQASQSSRLIRLWESYYFRHHQDLASKSTTRWEIASSPPSPSPSPAPNAAAASANPPSPDTKKKSKKPKEGKSKDDKSPARLRSMTTTAPRTNGVSKAYKADGPAKKPAAASEATSSE